MSFNAVFYTFSKRENSTSQPSGSGTTLSVELKDNSSVVEPVLRLHNTANWNPSALNYCYISEFSRYYFVKDWEYALGEWNCYLQSDVLASFKSDIGSIYKYILRSASDYTLDCVDDYYPPLAAQPSHWETTTDFIFSRDFDGGVYVLGVACNDSDGAGATTYYILTSTQIRNLVNVMLKPTSGWNNSFTGMTDVLYRSIYQPFDYIKSCKWFPTGTLPLVSTSIKFGNYDSGITGQVLDNDASSWLYITKDISLPSNWLTLEGKYRSNPYTHIYLQFNPWGVMELNPVDFSDSKDLRLYVYPDYISGDALLQIFKIDNGTEYFITQKLAKLSVDINLSSASLNGVGLMSGLAGTLGAIAGAVTGNPLMSVLSLAGASGGNLVGASTPTASNSIGQTTNGARFMDGIAKLILTETAFTDSDNTEFGRPLYKTKRIDTLSGYIKCADGEHNVPGYIDEKKQISVYMTEGFFYE